MRFTLFALAASWILLASIGRADQPGGPAEESPKRVQYLEIVTKDVDSVCAAYTDAQGLEFGDPDPSLGGARTASRSDGSLVGVRAPLRATEDAVVRPYWLVADIEAAVAAVVEVGGEVAHPPLEIPGHGKFAIYFLGGVEHGLWEL